jgi:3-mercaptopyruvate sulfurtransferase SseA
LRKKRRNQKKRPYLLIGLGGVLILGAVLLLLLDTQEAQAPTSTQPVTRTSEVERVSLTDAVDALDTGSAVFLDVRSQGEYSVSRIPGAVSIPIDQLPDRFTELDRDDWIITYCT